MGHVVTNERAERAGLRSRIARAYRATSRGRRGSPCSRCPPRRCTATWTSTRSSAPPRRLHLVVRRHAPYLCVENVCQRPACAADSECRARGGAFASSICLRPNNFAPLAQCVDNAQCGVGQPVIHSNRCVSATATPPKSVCSRRRVPPCSVCRFCVDPTWDASASPITARATRARWAPSRSSC